MKKPGRLRPFEAIKEKKYGDFNNPLRQRFLRLAHRFQQSQKRQQLKGWYKSISMGLKNKRLSFKNYLDLQKVRYLNWKENSLIGCTAIVISTLKLSGIVELTDSKERIHAISLNNMIHPGTLVEIVGKRANLWEVRLVG